MAGMNPHLPLPTVVSGTDRFMGTPSPVSAPGGHTASAEQASHNSPHDTILPNPALPSPWGSIGFDPGTFLPSFSLHSSQRGHRVLT